MAYDKERDIYGIVKDKTAKNTTTETDMYGFRKRKTGGANLAVAEADGLNDIATEQPRTKRSKPTRQSNIHKSERQGSGTVHPRTVKRKIAKSEYVFWLVIAAILSVCIFFGTLIFKELTSDYKIVFDGVEDFTVSIKDGIEHYSGKINVNCSLYNPYSVDDIFDEEVKVNNMECQTSVISGEYSQFSVSKIHLDYPEQDREITARDTKLGSKLVDAGHVVYSNLVDLDLSGGKIVFSKIYRGIAEDGAIQEINSGNPFVYKFTIYNSSNEVKAVYELSVFLHLDGDSKARLISFHQAAEERRHELAVAISPAYDELLMNSGAYEGQVVTYRGKVVDISSPSCKIQEDNSGKILILRNCHNSNDEFKEGYFLRIYGYSKGNMRTVEKEILPTIEVIDKSWSLITMRD